MEKHDIVLSLIKNVTDQSEFIFEKLVTWFIFYATLNLTALVSGYLSILKNENAKNTDSLHLMNQLLYWGSVAFYLSTYFSVVGCIGVFCYFLHQTNQIKNLVEEIAIPYISNEVFLGQFYTFSFVTVLFVFIVLLFTVIWYRVRKKNKFENPIKVLVLKKPFKKQGHAYQTTRNRFDDENKQVLNRYS